MARVYQASSSAVHIPFIRNIAVSSRPNRLLGANRWRLFSPSSTMRVPEQTWIAQQHSSIRELFSRHISSGMSVGRSTTINESAIDAASRSATHDTPYPYSNASPYLYTIQSLHSTFRSPGPEYREHSVSHWLSPRESGIL